MSTLKESLYDLWRVTSASPTDMELVEHAVRGVAPARNPEEFAAAAADLAKLGVPIGAIPECLGVVRRLSEAGGHLFSVGQAAHVVGSGLALFGADVSPNTLGQFARQVVALHQERS